MDTSYLRNLLSAVYCLRSTSTVATLIVLILFTDAEHVFHRRNHADMDALNPLPPLATVDDEISAVVSI